MNDIKRNIILVMTIIFIGLGIAGGTFAYFTASANVTGNSIAGDTLAINTNIGVTAIRSGNLVPTADNLILTSLNGSYPCEDARGYSLCSLYDIMVTNTGPAITLNGYISLNNTTTYTTNHLKYQLFSNNNDTYRAISDEGVLDITGGTNNYIRTNNKKYDFKLNNGTYTKHYYLVIWLSDIGANQLEDVNKELSANIVFEGQNGGSITAFLGSNIRVTFDPNGGTVNTTSKEVILGETYGALPQPTRTGYTFLGWNGKNMFNEEEWLMAINGAEYQDGHYVFLYGPAWRKYGNGNTLPLGGFKENTQYTYSIYGYVSGDGTYLSFYFGYGGTPSSTRIDFEPETETMVTGTSLAGSTVLSSFISFHKSRTAHITHIQLEEGTEATAYEPYYITSDTTVVQNKNHTLTAIWQKN